MKKNTILIMFGLILLSSIPTDFLSGNQNILYISGVFSIILMLLLIKNDLKINKRNFFIFNLFTFGCLISSLINMDIVLLNKTLKLYISYFILIIVLPEISKQSLIDILKRSIYIIGFIIILLSMIKQDPLSTPYIGVFNNPNSLGMFLITVFTIILAAFTESVINKGLQISGLFYIPLLMLLSFLIIQTSSRTSFITMSILIFLSIILITHFTIKRLPRIKVMHLFLLPITIGLLFFISNQLNIIEVFEETVLNKFERKEQDLLSGRTMIWKHTFDNASFFGNGSSYFLDNFNLVAHNIFVEALGSYGWVPLILLILFYMDSTRTIIKHFHESVLKNNLSLLPLYILLTFILFGLLESINASILMYTFYVLLGYSLTQHYVNVVNKKFSKI